MKILLLLCQIANGEITHCSPPHAVKGHMYSQVIWQSEQPSWEACMAEANKRNAKTDRAAYAADWKFFCYPVTPDAPPPMPAKMGPHA
jgi:hypothetical protein